VTRKAAKRKPEDTSVSGNKKQKEDLNSSQIFCMLQELLKRSENNEASTSGYNTGENQDTTEDFIPVDDESNIDQQDLFSVDNDPEVIFDENNYEFSMPKIFEDETKFCSPVSENLATFIKMGCTQKAEVSKYFDEIKVPENCKHLVPPLINSEIWNTLYVNVQQRDKTIQEAQRILGLAIVPMINLAEMFKRNKFDMKQAKKDVSDAITLACNAMYEVNARRRYILRPYVHKKFQQLCSAATPIEEKTLFPSNVTKRMKEIADASKINKQMVTGQNSYNSRNFNGSKTSEADHKEAEQAHTGEEEQAS
jgi:hypothetical protein